MNAASSTLHAIIEVMKQLHARQSMSNHHFSMQQLITRGAAVALLVTLAFPVPVSAQSRSDWRSFYRRSSEGMVDESTQSQVASRRGISSSVRNKIEDLDDDRVDDLPVPILLGIAPSALTRNFGDPRDGGARSHEGLDILAPKRAYIVSPTEAVVIRTGTGSSAGNYVYTANPGDETFAYMHLDEIAEGVRTGTVLKKGDLIGYVGNTGNAAGGPTHLHFEIREGREATDPFPRLTEEFTLKERMKALESILDDSDDEDEEAEALITSYRGLFVAAKAQNIDIPKQVEDVLKDAGVSVTPSAAFVRNLTLGSSGQDVVALQAFLIAQDSGAKARLLADAGATGYFGAVTQAALAEYQTKQGISPASGYFGPLTRAKVAR